MLRNRELVTVRLLWKKRVLARAGAPTETQTDSQGAQGSAGPRDGFLFLALSGFSAPGRCCCELLRLRLTFFHIDILRESDGGNNFIFFSITSLSIPTPLILELVPQ